VGANEPGQPIPDTLTGMADGAISVNVPVPSTALAIGAHPDDVEFGAGATLAKWAAGGCVVHHLICTDGSKGTWDVDADTDALVGRRRQEQIAAARRLSGADAGQVIFLGQVDGELSSSLELRGAVARVIRQVRPDVVLGHDPWKRYRLHPDHRHAGLLACDAVVAARDPHFFREHAISHYRPQTMLLWEADVVDHVEDVSGFVDAKLDALCAHRSQFESTMQATDDEQVEQFRRRIRDRLTGFGALHGLAAAELFKRIDDL
jgi:LmbE family N-acetylglucosaminyl deacetylase